MSALAATLKSIETAVDEMGLPAFSAKSGVPYTTLAYWRARNWRPRVIETLAAAEAAAEAHLNPEPQA